MAKIKVIFPSILTNVTNGEKLVNLDASNLGEAVNLLVKKYGTAFSDKVFDSPGKVRRLLNFYINGKNMHHLKDFETILRDGDEVSLLPAVGGG